MPFALAADDHQRKNAEVFRAAGAARMLTEAELTSDALLASLTQLLADRGELLAMGERARMLARPDAVGEIAAVVARLTGMV